MYRKQLALFFITFVSSCFAQSYNFNNYSLEDGLPQSTVFEIFQDQRDFLWLGTDGGGVVQFDGLKFKTFSKREGLAGSTIRAINQDKNGNLWIGTDNGLSIYDGKKIKNLPLLPTQTSKLVYKIFIDKNENIWVSYPGLGLLKYKDVQDSVPKLYSSNNGLSNNFIFDIIELSDSQLILTTYNGGINILNSNTNEVKVFSTDEGLPSAIILCVEKDNKGNFWFGSLDSNPFYINEKALQKSNLEATQIKTIIDFPDKTVRDITFGPDGLYFATDKAGIVFLSESVEQEYNTSNGLPTNQILKVFIDKSGSVWTGTNGSGISKFSGAAFSHISVNQLTKSEEQVFSILQADAETFWIAGYGTGLSKIKYVNGKTTYLKTFTKADGLNDNFLKSLCFDADGNLWIGTETNGIAVYNGSKFSYITSKFGLPDNKINSIFKDSKNTMWVSTPNGVTKIYEGTFENANESNGLINNEVQSVIEDKLGNIWIATLGGIARYNGSTLENYDEAEGLSEKRINCLVVSAQNELIVGTFGGGLFYTDANDIGKSKFHPLANDSVLSSNNIFGLCFLNDGELMIATDKGIDKATIMDHKLVQNKSFDKTDGFASVENNLNAILKTKDNQVWFGTIKGITIFDTKALVLNTKAPKIHLTDVRLFDKSMNWSERNCGELSWTSFPEHFNLRYDENNLTFYFQAINLSNPSKVNYKYKLKGADKDWITVVNLHEVSYPALNPGEYAFMVMASNENNIWSEPLALNFTIEPPFYKTWWFLSILISLLILSTIFYVKWRESELKKKNIQLENTISERTHEITDQKKVIEEKNRNITDSIIYARRIQKAILPPEEKIRLFLKNSFVIYYPKDIISGDFYYFNILDKNGTMIEDDRTEPRYHVIAVADCTGHGVPGALMSMIGFNGLNHALSKSLNSGEVLDTLSSFVEKSLGTHSAETIKDGMDICICIIDLETKTMHFSGANNPLYIIRKEDDPAVEGAKTDASVVNGKLIYELKADKQPIGSFEDKKVFTAHSIPLCETDELVLFTDGFADQFGGPAGKKFKYSSMKRLLLENSNKSMHDQKEEIQKTFIDWKNDLEQTDDVCLIGLCPFIKN